MSFLQPWMLWLLPAMAIPIAIHLINQRRYQTTQWAAMMFLLSANRMNRGYAKIRQYVILALRTLVIAALVLAIGRPLAGGSLGGDLLARLTGRGATDAIVVLDRSPSMAMRSGGLAAGPSKRDRAVTMISETLSTLGVPRITLIESHQKQPIELENAGELSRSPLVGSSGASSDVPGMLLAAAEHIQTSGLGQTDVWIASDLRAHDWRPRDGRWAAVRESFAGLGNRVRLRLLADPTSDGEDVAVRVEDAELRTEDGQTLASVSIAVTPSPGRGGSLPVSLEIDGSRSTLEVNLTPGETIRVQHRVPVAGDTDRAIGRVSVPADAAPGDDAFFFTLQSPPPRRSVVVTDDESVGGILKLAAGITPDRSVETSCEIVSPSEVASIDFGGCSFIAWHADFPIDESERDLLTSFAQNGGRVLFLPPPSPGDASMFGVTWADWQTMPADASVASWRGESDLLAATMAGESLPVGRLRIGRMAAPVGDATTLATVSGGERLLCRVPTRRGAAYFCGTTPLDRDSSLAADGVVLYVMIQRAIADGVAATGNSGRIDAGEAAADEAATWDRLAGDATGLSTEQAFQPGVYADGETWVAINRSAGEDDRAVLTDSQVDALLAGLPVTRVGDVAGPSRSLVDEVWRAFVMLMLIALIGEAAMCLPRRVMHAPEVAA